MQNVNIQIGSSASANFEDNTWTFQFDTTVKVAAGRYAILEEAEYKKLLGMAQQYDAVL